MQKRTAKRKVHKKRKNIFKIIIPIVLISIFVFWVFNSTFFNIETININGNKALKKEDILKKTNITKNTNIFKMKLRKIESRLEEDPFIKSVKIKREIPNGLAINIKEREPTFIFKSLSKYLVSDEEGFIIEVLKKSDKKLPLIKGFKTEASKVGENLFSNQENENLKVFIDDAKLRGILYKIEEVDKDYANDINIELKNSIPVEFGTLDDTKVKLRMLEEILMDIEKRDLKAKKITLNKGDQYILTF